jgi:SpoVK/Ycf46/Vps4 family AAA+-type ATPase
MAGSGDHIKALLKSHAEGDDAAFYAVAGQIAAQEARRGHSKLAADLKKAIEAAKAEPVVSRNVTPIARPRGDLADLVTASFPDARFRDLILPGRIHAQIQEVLAEQRQRKVLSERGFDPVHRLLLEGPPGTGKTMTASVLAHELSLPLLTVRLESLLSKFLGETAAKLRLVFDAVRDHRAVYLFDEFDALGADRSGNDIGEARRILNSFLVFLDEAAPESIVIAATNHSSILDRALFRRFDMVIHYELPSLREAREVLRLRLGSMGTDLRLDRIATGKAVDGLSHAELEKAAEAAAKQALIRGDSRVIPGDLKAALENRRSTRHAVER